MTMFRWFALVLLALAFPALANPMWHADGTRLVDGAGRPVRISGFNLGNWLMWEGWMFGGTLIGGESAMMQRIAGVAGMPAARAFHRDDQDAYITESDTADIARAGFTTLRLPINYRALVGGSGCLPCDGQGWRHIDALLGWAKAQGLHVILDMHAVPGGQAGLMTADARLGHADYWTNSRNQARLATLWIAVARRYAGNETVAGYDLINEPEAPSREALVAAYRALIVAIRRVDRNHMIWLEGNHLSADLDSFAAPMGPNVGYSIHIYTFPSDDRRQRTDLAAATAARLGAPVWIGEFGLMDDARTAETVRMIDAAPGVVGWSFWTWKRAANDTPSACALDVPAEWQAVAPWVTGAILRIAPSRGALTEGMRAWIDFLRSQRCTPDPRLIAALGGVPGR